MDLWTDLNSGADWGLDLFNQPNGPFGDLKDVSHPKGDINPACKPGDTIEQMAYSPTSEGPLDFEWMEAGDLGSYLDALDKGQERVSLQDNVFDFSQELGLKDNVSVSDGQSKFLPTVSNIDIISYDQGLTPPESPEQVAPIIKLDPQADQHLWNLQAQYNPALQKEISVQGSSSIVIETSVDFLADQIDLKPELFSESDIFGLTFTPAADLGPVSEPIDSNEDNGDVSYTYSSDDGSSILSESPSPRPSIDALIQSSPELYKVIAAPSDLSARFSPYNKSKGGHKSKGASTKVKAEKQSPEIIPEELFPSNLGKKERKKLQNKNAAIRYRQKKKAEVECIVSEVQGLEDRNQELKTKVDDLQREVKYMKSLMEDIYRAKGLLK